MGGREGFDKKNHDEKEEGREKGGKREKIVKINDKSVRNIENISSSYCGRRKEGREGAWAEFTILEAVMCMVGYGLKPPNFKL
jgi:hypothetical protein